MIVTVGGEKGGSGKTTLAATLAAYHAVMGNDVLLVNADPQQSASYWSEQRRFYHPDAKEIVCVSVRGGKIHHELRDLERRYGTLVVDTGGRDSAELRSALVVTDRVLLPVRPEQFDLATLPKMEDLISQAEPLNERLRASVVLNQVPSQGRDRLAKEARDWLSDTCPKLPAISVVIGFRAAFGRANAEGLAVTEMSRKDTKACAEATRLYREAFENGN
jgi:chromosome partitioning protein